MTAQGSEDAAGQSYEVGDKPVKVAYQASQGDRRPAERGQKSLPGRTGPAEYPDRRRRAHQRPAGKISGAAGTGGCPSGLVRCGGQCG